MKKKTINIFCLIYGRSRFQCNLLCEGDENCYGYKWEESEHMCTMIQKDGLCIDESRQNLESVFIEESNMCNTLCLGMFATLKLWR